MNNKVLIWIMALLSSVLLSIPWLVPHTGALILVAFIPLLCADAVAEQARIRHFFFYYFSAFLIWNAATTFWVCNATVGGGIFAALVNTLLMSLVWALFRFFKKRAGGVLPYVFLAFVWVAWERLYLNAQISWPWLCLGNAFGRTTRLVQWYEYTGTLGGSLWVWAVNLLLFGFLNAILDGIWQKWNSLRRCAMVLTCALAIAGPVLLSYNIFDNYEEESEGTLDVVIAQPNFDPYQKFESLSQRQQTDILLDLFRKELASMDSSSEVLLLAPETFTSDIMLDNVAASPTVESFIEFLSDRPGAQILFGASTYQLHNRNSAPSILARKVGDKYWAENHNSAVLLKPDGRYDIFHKSKLVVGTELTPYPKLFVPLDDWLSRKMNVNGLMGRCIGQEEISLLDFSADAPLGCAVCYESVYGEYCTGYVKKGAKAMTVITNDAWWGDTPGYRQHMSYSCLRAIELRRDIARCGNTGISAFIDQRGDVLSESRWWTRQVLRGSVNLNSRQTFFVRHGDITGRACQWISLLLMLLFVGKAAAFRKRT